MKLFISGGIGDFITMEPFISQDEKNSVEEIAFAARGAYGIKQIIQSYPIFPNLKTITTIFDDWSQIFSIQNINHLLAENARLNLGLDLHNINEYVDFSISLVFEQIRRRKRQYQETPFFQSLNSQIDIPVLPYKYGVINPYSPNNNHNGQRGFTKKEWDNVLNNVRSLRCPFVVINYSNDYIPDSSMLINLNKQTTLPQAIEIAKRAKWYIGVDSWLSAFMPKVLPKHRMVIKTVNVHFTNHMFAYLAPYDEYSSVHWGLEHFKLDRNKGSFLC